MTERTSIEMHSPEELVYLIYDMAYAAGLASGMSRSAAMQSVLLERSERFEQRAIEARTALLAQIKEMLGRPK